MPTPTVASLVQLLEQQRLLPPAQLAEVDQHLRRSFPDAAALIKELVRRGWLTGYQAQRIAEGKGGELVLGSYVVLDRIGAGGSGAVFKARHQKMQRLVALKILRREASEDAEAVQRFYREIEVASQLSHANIVHAYEAGPIGSLLVLVMEFVDGPDLERLVHQAGPLPLPLACGFIRQAAIGLQYAHQRGLVHRDIKPSNLLLRIVESGSRSDDRPSVVDQASQVLQSAIRNPQSVNVKILDLGLARLHGQQSRTANITIAVGGKQVMQGTPDYMAPEQALDFHTADIRSDIYSLGCTFYFLLTGAAPFAGGTLAEKLMKHQQAEPPSLTARRRDVPPEVTAIVGRMLAKAPADRYQTPGEIAQALSGWGGNATDDIKQPTLVAGRPKWRNSRRLAILGVCSFIAVAGFCWLLMIGKGSGGNQATPGQLTGVAAGIVQGKPGANQHEDWTVLDATSCRSETPGGATLTRQPDQSILASTAPPVTKERYTVVADTPLSGITGIRLEVLPHTSLPKQGPGRAPNGNLVLTQFQVEVAPAGAKSVEARPVPIPRAIADFTQGGHAIAFTIDPAIQAGWAILPEVGKPHIAVFEFKEPVGFTNGTTITCKLDQNHWGHSIGRFRLAVTTRKPPLALESSPATPGRVLFSDDFESGAGKWTVTHGNYAVVAMDGSRRYQAINLPTDMISRSIAGDANWQDYTLEGLMRISDIHPEGLARLMARFQGTHQWYGFGYYKKSGAWQIVKRTADAETVLGSGRASGLDGQRYYAVRVQVKGATLQLFVDGMLQVNVNDATYARGKIGLMARHATVLIDDVSVSALE